jgi:hypothetical protein
MSDIDHAAAVWMPALNKCPGGTYLGIIRKIPSRHHWS